MTMQLFLLFRIPRSMNLISWSLPVESSGMIAASAPAAMALFCARKPASRPITSTKKIRSCDVAVSRILSTHCVIVFNVVSYPIVLSVPYKSLSIVPGKPIHGMSYSSAKIRAPVREPFPPITISASIASRFNVSNAFFLPAAVSNSLERAVRRIVPPVWMILLTSSVVKRFTSPFIRPSYPRYIPFTLKPLQMALRVTARMAAFIPGASPPEVRTPTHLILPISFNYYSVLLYRYSAMMAKTIKPQRPPTRTLPVTKRRYHVSETFSIRRSA